MPHEPVAGTDIAVASLRLFPPKVRASVLERDDFRGRFSLSLDASVRFNQSGAVFTRSKLFSAIRQVMTGTISTIDVTAKDGLVWRVTRDESTGIRISREAAVVSLPECVVMSTEVGARLEWFDRQTSALRVSDRHTQMWREILAQRPLEDEELDRVLAEFRLTPMFVAGSLRAALRRESFGVDDLVPSSIRYFERLVSEPTNDSSVQEFVATTVASHVGSLMETSPPHGLRAALLLSSLSSVAELIDLSRLQRADVLEAFQWLANEGDRISQVGGIECGLRLLHLFPELEPILATMTSAIAADQPEEPNGRLRLLSALVALVEGEIARRNIARKRPPFWRRMATIAHASAIEREVMRAGLNSASIVDWALQSGGSLFYIQTLIDLRREPRWFPDFISPQQLKAEFVGRIAGAAERYRANVPDGALSSLLWGSDPGTIQSQMDLSAIMPGPLEGGMEAVREIPPELEERIRTDLGAEELTPSSFVALVNSSLIFHIGSKVSELAAQALRRVGYQLRKVNAADDAFPLLNGLAMVSAVSRSKELADEVRILARGARRREGKKLSPEASARIALIAAAAHQDETAWSNFVGEWLTELGFADMTADQATDLQRWLYILFHLEPLFWENCGRGEAALAAFVASVPESAG